MCFRSHELVLDILYLGSCQNSGPFLGTLNSRVPLYIRHPKRDPSLTTTHLSVSRREDIMFTVAFGDCLAAAEPEAAGTD